MNDPRFRIDRSTLRIDGLQHTYRVMHLSDAHLNPDSSLDSEEDRAKAAQLREVWMQHGNGLTAAENFERLIAFGKEEAVDLFALAGDMTDFPSPGTAAEGKAMYDTTGQFLYVLGNHEAGKAHEHLFAPATGGNPIIQVRDVGELRFVGVHNAAHTVDSAVLDTLSRVLYGDKPVILVQHTPLSVDTLRPDAIAYWQDVSYFLFGETGLDDNAREYVRLLTTERTQLKAVLCGHLHLAHTDTYDNGVVQYISAPTLSGYGHLLTVTGE